MIDRFFKESYRGRYNSVAVQKSIQRHLVNTTVVPLDGVFVLVAVVFQHCDLV